MSVIEDVRFLAVAGFYVACNFMPLWMLFAGYLIVTGQFWGYVLLIVFAADFLIPLQTPGMNLTWCDLTNETEGGHRELAQRANSLTNSLSRRPSKERRVTSRSS